MSMFDSLINEVGERFGIGDKAGTLLSSLLALITNSKTGGISGFLDMFSHSGLGDMAMSWVSSGANSAVSNEQLESAVGKSTLQGIADNIGLPFGTSTSALGFMLPQVIDKLTPNGEVPDNDSLLSTIGGYLTGAGGAVLGAIGVAGATASGAFGAGVNAVGDTAKAGYGAAGDAAKTVTSGVGNTASYVGDKIDDVSGGGGILKWVLPLLLLGLLLFLGYQFCGNAKKPEVAGTNVNKPVVGNSNAGVAKAIDSSLKVEARDGKYYISGTVADEKTKKEIEAKFAAELGADKCDFSGLKIDANAKPASWLSKVYEFLPSLKGGEWKTGSLTFGENKLEAVGDLPKTIVDKIKGIFTGWTLMPAIAFAANEAEAAKTANEEAAKQLATAKTPEEIVKALNLTIIQFDTGKSTINPASMEIVKKASEVLKTVPGGTVIEVGGHTDNVGNKDKNLKLSEDRAKAVKTELEKLGVTASVLAAKGYGDTKPKADNSTATGKAQNRRIEYTLGGDAPVTGTTTTTTTNTNAAKPANSNK